MEYDSMEWICSSLIRISASILMTMASSDWPTKSDRKDLWSAPSWRQSGHRREEARPWVARRNGRHLSGRSEKHAELENDCGSSGHALMVSCGSTRRPV